ncbi:DNA-binding transcriptional ArsR family regulator [Afipia massiliensis]|uniref:DNA-binding transcriptional ArsR family regulator n=1 Tax=Afipia massiliensis TaxID=211460 RepID=A0A840N7B5_9BRAD|nr:metalloregulator ArsR/SmtB family transcription factor [Afipia massiliensis]MBB5055070.1 DNA-binding transcriptional ArsR family regulator [Afipia massiliensis]
MTQLQVRRTEAANACIEVLDTAFFNALCEPVRVQLVRALVLQGEADIQTIAAGFKQDRSVISRHLQVLEKAGIVFSTKTGRHQIFQLNGPEIVERMEAMLRLMRTLVPICCPGR